MELEKVKIEHVAKDTYYLIKSDGCWDVAECWPAMDKGERWFNGDVFLDDPDEIYELPLI